MRVLALILVLAPVPSFAGQATPAAAAPAPTDQAAAQPPQTAKGVRVSCGSAVGERVLCAANTSSGVVLARSTGEAACLLGKTWGYDDTGIWVSDGCVADFVVVGGVAEQRGRRRPLTHVPHIGIPLFNS